MIAAADQIIDVGPGAGHEGGTVVFTGTPAELVVQSEVWSEAEAGAGADPVSSVAPSSLTGHYLAAAVAG